VELIDPRVILSTPYVGVDTASEESARTVVHAEGLTKSFRPRSRLRDVFRFADRAPAVTVVDQVTLRVNAGEVFGLLGPNGAGKTTIFKMLSTMVAPDAGFATVAGFDVLRDPRSVRALLATVPADERSLNWRLSAYENLRLFAALQQLPRGLVEARIGWVLKTVALADARETRVAEFSSGMKQRLLVARALLTEPEILLLDEPTRTLDPLSARELRRFLRKELVDALGCAILLATHNADEAFGFCDRVAVLDRGRVLATGPALELAARFSDDRYRIILAGDATSAIAALEQRRLVLDVGRSEPAPEGWEAIECTIPGGPSCSAHVLSTLVGLGAEVARLERVEPSLADLISRIIGADRAGIQEARTPSARAAGAGDE
jgi:ABC-2 type transport system ATP-binding protein